MRLVIYGDFNCPYSCLASARAERLVAAGIADVDWRAVEHDDEIPAPSQPAEGELREMFDREVEEILGLLRPGEEFPMKRPPVQPNTALATDAFASLPPDARSAAKRRLFDALWFDGRDIGDPTLVRQLVGSADDHGVARAREWRDQWLGLEKRLVPMLVLPDGKVSRGLGALRRLADFAIPA